MSNLLLLLSFPDERELCWESWKRCENMYVKQRVRCRRCSCSCHGGVGVPALIGSLQRPGSRCYRGINTVGMALDMSTPA